MQVRARIRRAWSWLSSALDLQQLLALVGLWKIAVFAGGAVVGLLVAAFGRFPWWGWLLATAVSAGLALFISNEITSRRLQRRHPSLGRKPARPIAGSAELVQFVNAWLMPAWERALGLLVRVREEVRRVEGERIETLLQLAIIEPAVTARQTLQNRLAGEGTLSLEELLADGYRKYEFVVRWLWHSSEKINLVPILDSQGFADWQLADEKLIDHLHELIANPKLELPNLNEGVREIEGGGVAKEVRLKLSKITALSVVPQEHGKYVRLQVSNKRRDTIRKLRADGRIVFGALLSEESDYPIRWRGRNEAEIDLVSGRPPEILDVAEFVESRELKFHTAAMALSGGQTTEHFCRNQTETVGFVLRVVFSADTNLEYQDPRYYQIRMNEDDAGFFATRVGAPDEEVRRDQENTAPYLFVRELTEEEARRLIQR